VLSQVPAWLQRFLYIAGGLFILYLAYGTFKSWKNFDQQAAQPESAGNQSVFKAALMNTLSPNPYIYWVLVTGPILI
ncbi:LysE family transporter, partial [bacterium]|nr:LysE family transporter [bacterium]